MLALVPRAADVAADQANPEVVLDSTFVTCTLLALENQHQGGVDWDVHEVEIPTAFAYSDKWGIDSPLSSEIGTRSGKNGCTKL